MYAILISHLGERFPCKTSGQDRVGCRYSACRTNFVPLSGAAEDPLEQFTDRVADEDVAFLD